MVYQNKNRYERVALQTLKAFALQTIIYVKLQLRKGVPGGRRIWLKKVGGKNGQERGKQGTKPTMQIVEAQK